jgi:Amt family ammonium transporter
MADPITNVLTRTVAHQATRLGDALTALRKRMSEPERKRVFLAVLGAKTIAVLLLCGTIYGLSNFVGTARAADAAAVAPYINPINTMWTLVAAFLVFFMQAGFMMLEAGFARGRETVNILL